jgi:3-isopropylmalate dehydrogenase
MSRPMTAPVDRRYTAAPAMAISQSRWSSCIAGRPPPGPNGAGAHVLGALPGEGSCPEIVDATLRILETVFGGSSVRVDVRRHDGPVCPDGRCDEPTAAFCASTFADGGAVLAGAMSGRFVYEMRRRFRLFCKVSPVQVWDELAVAGKLRPEVVRGVDILLVRENASGLYQGEWNESHEAEHGRVAWHRFRYAEDEVRAILEVAAAMAALRRGGLSVVLKDGGVPGISPLWRDCAAEIGRARSLSPQVLNVDYAAYRLVQHPSEFDVVVAPNFFGDVLADLGGVLLGSRAVTFSGNFARDGAAVYQTNHGAALDLTGKDSANPAGQILALAMLLRESFGREREAGLIERALRRVWRDGFTTSDLPLPGARVVGTREMCERIADTARRLVAESPPP